MLLSMEVLVVWTACLQCESIHYWIWNDHWENRMSEMIIMKTECLKWLLWNLELNFDIGIYSDRWIYLMLVPVPYDLNYNQWGTRWRIIMIWSFSLILWYDWCFNNDTKRKRVYTIVTLRGVVAERMWWASWISNDCLNWLVASKTVVHYLMLYQYDGLIVAYWCNC